jgi:hexosaminidase
MSLSPFKNSITFLLFFCFSLFTNAQQKFDLMPVPREIKIQEGKFRLGSDFKISVSGKVHPRLYGYASRILRRLDGRTGLYFSQDYVTAHDTVQKAALLIKCMHPGELKLMEDESYQLQISKDKIEISAITDLGAIHALETLLQLLSADGQGYYFPVTIINDQPRFPWRGLMIDVSRHFMTMDVIKRNIDGMAAVKMDVLHLHLSDDQGFRIECKTFPKLHQLGSDGLFYTQEQIKEIINYAGERGIRVVPEFDIPGHTSSWFVGYPELASLPGPYTIERKFGVFNPSMDPSKESTYQFLDAFFKEMCGLFPDPYFHIGGDENNGKQWKQSPSIQAFKKEKKLADNHALQSYFNQRLLTILTKYGKNMGGWDEILQPDMPRNILIQSWRGKESMIEAAKKGYKTILSNGYYIDLVQPTAFHYLNDPCPPEIQLNVEEKKNILGGEAAMWSEFVTVENIDSRIWPRTAAIAERLWSPVTVNNVDDMYQRLRTTSFHLEELGLTHQKNYEMMLRRLTNGKDIYSLKTLADVIEPVKIYERFNQGVNYTSFSPLTQMADAARPDADTARHFRDLVKKYIETGDGILEAQITSILIRWCENHKELSKIIDGSPILQEIEPMSKRLMEVSIIGLEAIKNRRKASVSPEWTKESLQLLEEAKKPAGKCELMIIGPVEDLVKFSSKILTEKDSEVKPDRR